MNTLHSLLVLWKFSDQNRVRIACPSAFHHDQELGNFLPSPQIAFAILIEAGLSLAKNAKSGNRVTQRQSDTAAATSLPRCTPDHIGVCLNLNLDLDLDRIFGTGNPILRLGRDLPKPSRPCRHEGHLGPNPHLSPGQLAN